MPFVQNHSVASTRDSYVLDIVSSPFRALIAAPRASGSIQILSSETLAIAATISNQAKSTTLSEVKFADHAAGPQHGDALLWSACHEGRLSLTDLRAGCSEVMMMDGEFKNGVSSFNFKRVND